MSNRQRILSREVVRLTQVVARREVAVTKAQAALKDKRGIDPEGNLARRVTRLARARHRLAMAQEREEAAA